MLICFPQRASAPDNNFQQVPWPENAQSWVAADGTRWLNVPPQTTTRTVRRSWRPTYGQAGVKHSLIEVADAQTEAEIFGLMFTEEILQTIVQWTNRKAELEWSPEDHAGKPWKPVDVTELRAYIGLLLMMGLNQNRKTPASMMWSSDPKYKRHPIVATMSRDRFLHINSYLRFDDVTTRDERRQQDKLAAIREVHEALVQRFQDIYTPHGHLTVDEMIVPFHGRFAASVFIKSKPRKEGIKVWALADSESRYTLNMQVNC